MITVTLTSSREGHFKSTMGREDGAFEFSNVRAGAYTITAEAPGFEPAQESVEVRRALRLSYFVVVNLEKRTQEENRVRPPPGERTVALDWLSIPKKARKEMGKADRESEKNKPKQTIEHLRKAIKIHPKFYQAYNNLAVQHLRLRQKAEAIEAFEKSIEIQPENPTAYLNLGIIRLQEQDYWGSYGWLRKAFELDPNDLQTELFLGQNCYHLGLYLRALNRFQNVARQNPEAAGPYLWMGQCHLLLRRYKEALSEFERFVAIEPDFDNVKVTRFGGE